jgi:hypothetical protein
MTTGDRKCPDCRWEYIEKVCNFERNSFQCKSKRTKIPPICDANCTNPPTRIAIINGNELVFVCEEHYEELYSYNVILDDVPSLKTT